jgi:lipopolysaccharide transport system ATP-binding protein
MYVRLAFAVAAHLDPEILILDEVLAVGDAGFQRRCLGKMQDSARSGRTILFVSHNMSAVRQLCSQAILLDAGQIAARGSPQEVLSTYLAGEYHGAEGAATFAATPEKKLQMLRVAITDERGQPLAMPLDLNAPFAIDFTYVVRQPVRAPYFSFELLTPDGDNVVFLDSRESPVGPPLEVGEHRMRIPLPACLLNTGRYMLACGVRDAPDMLEAIDPVLEIIMHDLEARRTQRRPGYHGVKPRWMCVPEA